MSVSTGGLDFLLSVLEMSTRVQRRADFSKDRSGEFSGSRRDAFVCGNESWLVTVRALSAIQGKFCLLDIMEINMRI